MLLVYPDPPAPELAQILDLSGHPWKSVSHAGAVSLVDGSPNDAGPQAGSPQAKNLTGSGWSGAIAATDVDPEATFRFCRAIRSGDVKISPVLLLLSGAQLHLLEHREELFDDFCLVPFHPREFEARLRHLLWRSGTGNRPEIIDYGALAMNLETYQATIAGRPLDLTYMEYELLRFLATHPGKVFTREVLLNLVWGYDYYGGARTVDVHIRRLRAKLGEEHAGLIETVRSVGYRFGRSRWQT